MELKKMCKKYLDAKNLENILKTSNKLEQKKEKIKIEILKLENNNNKLNKKTDACYNDKLEDNITLDMYKRAYNNFIGEIQTNNHKIEKYKEDLINLENNKLLDDDYYTNKIKEFMKLENPTRMFIASLIDKIEIDEDKNINIYYKFKLV
ncbi:MAG: hypothetical protein Q4E75_05380 [bacterium]|nr:hypothetical protein [bacterium]